MHTLVSEIFIYLHTLYTKKDQRKQKKSTAETYPHERSSQRELNGRNLFPIRKTVTRPESASIQKSIRDMHQTTGPAVGEVRILITSRFKKINIRSVKNE